MKFVFMGYILIASIIAFIMSECKTCKTRVYIKCEAIIKRVAILFMVTLIGYGVYLL